MNRRILFRIGLAALCVIAVVVAILLVFGNSDYCKTKRFLKAFGHPIFLVEEPRGFFAHYEIGNKKVSAKYPLSPAKFQEVKKEEVVDPFKCATNMLVIEFDDCSAPEGWCFEDGPVIDGRPDKVDGSNFDNIPEKVRNKLMKKFRKARKYLIKKLETDIAIHFKVKKPKN